MTELFLVRRDGIVYAVCSTLENAQNIVLDMKPYPESPVYIHTVHMDTFPMEFLNTVCCTYCN
jgi:hypothetical protein